MTAENPETAAPKAEAPIIEEPIAEESVVETAVPEVSEVAAEQATEQNLVEETPKVNYFELGLAEIAKAFEEFAKSADRLKRSKEADLIKSAFYKKLIDAKKEAGLLVEGDAETIEDQGEVHTQDNPFAEIENGFKAFYNAYKKERAEYNRQLDSEREDNLKAKQAVIEELKALLENQTNVSAAFPEFRKIQDKWKSIGPVPATNFRNLNDTYQLYVEKFYDMVSINRELRDLDFKKNLEAKTTLCEEAEKLSESENVVDAFKQLQKLHEQWKDLGPVAKEFRDSIWDRFKVATAVINKKYQAYFEGMKSQREDNLAAKTALCEKVEEIASKEVITAPEWNTLSKEIEELQQQWRKIGFVSRKENQQIYDRFRAACDKFFTRKREYYSGYKDNMNINLEKKIALCEEAEALKLSTEWKKTADRLIELQKQWKEIGAVPRKKSEELWKRFRAACDEFFAARDKEAKDENDFKANLKAKKALIEEIKAYEPTGDDAEALSDFSERWRAIGFVPFKEKDKIGEQYKAALDEKFPRSGHRPASSGARRQDRRPLSEKDKLIQKFNKLEQDITTYENNIGFFSMSKNAAPLISQMRDRIASAKEELKAIEQQIRDLAAAEDENNE